MMTVAAVLGQGGNGPVVFGGLTNGAGHGNPSALLCNRCEPDNQWYEQQFVLACGFASRQRQCSPDSTG